MSDQPPPPPARVICVCSRQPVWSAGQFKVSWPLFSLAVRLVEVGAVGINRNSFVCRAPRFTFKFVPVTGENVPSQRFLAVYVPEIPNRGRLKFLATVDAV